MQQLPAASPGSGRKATLPTGVAGNTQSTPEGNGAELAMLQGVIAAQQQRLDAQEQHLARLEHVTNELLHRDRPMMDAPAASLPMAFSGRRGLARLVGAAAGVAGLALVADGLPLGPRRAEATNGSPLIVAAINSFTLPTALTGAGGGSSGALSVTNTNGRGINVSASPAWNGIVSTSDTATGISGNSSSGIGVNGSATSGVAVRGNSDTGIDIYAFGTGRLRQWLASFTGAPTAGSYAKGEQIRDLSGDLYLCVSGGTPGTWEKVAAVSSGYAGGAIHMLSAPIRLLDTRPGQAAGVNPGAPLAANESYRLQVTGTAVGGVSVPTGAVAVIGNVTVVFPSGPGNLRLYGSHQPLPLVSNLNYVAGQVLANSAFVPISPSDGGMMIRVDGSPTDVIFDAAGFVM